MNLAIIIYCLLSGPLLIWDYFQRRKLQQRNDMMLAEMVVAKITSALSDQLIHELLERIYRLEEQLEETEPDAEE